MEQHKPEKIASSPLPFPSLISFPFSSPLLSSSLLYSFPFLSFLFLSSSFLPFPFPLLSSFSSSLLGFLSSLFSPFLTSPLLWSLFPSCPLLPLNFLSSFFLFHSITKASFHIFGQTRQKRHSNCKSGQSVESAVLAQSTSG